MGDYHQCFSRAAVLEGYSKATLAVGLDPIALLKQSDIDPYCLRYPDFKIPTASIIQLLELTASQANVADFGLRMAECRSGSALGLAELVLAQQPTLGAVIHKLLDIAWVQVDGLLLAVENVAGFVVFTADLEASLPGPAHQTIQLAMASMIKILERVAHTKIQCAAISFQCCEPGPSLRYVKIFGKNPAYGAEQNALTIRETDLALTLRPSDPVLEARLLNLLLDTTGVREPTIVDRTRHIIQILLPTGQCRITRVAAMLSVDRRTLNRWLSNHGVSFSELVQEVRMEVIRSSLRREVKIRGSMSDMLGFAHRSSFSRWWSHNKAAVLQEPPIRDDNPRQMLL
ncbi:AraC family transcriptional regulator ligand-binding domain-containing protein [Luminiphilus sp.]|nr:AraC family transcriptional regulator ligand-binding domain-containing protein [Luminiphilus sp.]MDB2379950.1 AraC family transcriptional regulator ligand-binding domain-containing protein [Luminiphilus sp.]MDB2623281.1 AraC family transcriptional regulator ligand-binding domain-containing protein [Luminiphilus sp.]